MPLDFRTRSVTLPSGTGHRSINDSVNFGSNVSSANVALNGFVLDYVNSDHHINIVAVNTDLISFAGNTVNFRVTADYADKNFDDRYRGSIEVLVIAEVA